MTPDEMTRIVRLAHVEANRTPEDLALLLAVWWEVLALYPAEEVQAAVLRFMAENPWPPKVSQILDLLTGTDSTTAGNARAAVFEMQRSGGFRPHGRPATVEDFPNEAAYLAVRELWPLWSTQSEAYMIKAFDEAYARHATNLSRKAREGVAVELASGNGAAIGSGD